MKFRVGGVVVGFLLSVLSLVQLTVAQSPTEIASALPHLVRFGGTVKDLNGSPLTGLVGVTFALYSEQTGGSALWMETQNVTADSNGHYTVLLGPTTSEGLPESIFTSEQAHWVGVQVSGQAEEPRVLLVSAPYALKAGDAETVGGYPASSFVMANSGGHSPGSKGKAAPGTETQNFIPIFIDNSGDLGNSILFQSGTTEVGINTTTPSATLEVNGTAKFDNLVNFASGQIFPGTLTGITAGTGINVTGSKTNPTVGINTTFANQFYAQLKAANTFTANQTVNGTMTATTFSGSGSGLTNVTAANANELGGLPPSSYQPAGSYATTGSNTFTGNQNITGNLAATGSVSGAAATFTGVVTEAGALLPASGTATASQGYNSQPFDSVTSVFNSTGGTAQNQDFRWLAEPVGNDTGSPSGKLDLLFGANGATPTETGLSVANNGIITFATGQTFGGGGGGTVTSVGTGLGLKGGPITTSGTLTIDTTVVPQLGAANTFTSSQTVNGTLTANANASSNFGIIGTTSSTATFAAGVEGGATATTGATIGVYGSSQSSAGYGLYGEAFSQTGLTFGVYGQTESSAGYGVKGVVDADTGSTAGVFGQAQSPTGYGVEGINGAQSGNSVGVYGTTNSPTGYGVEGQSAFVGVYGSGTTAGVSGQTTTIGGYGVEGTSPSVGVYGTGLAGVDGVTTSTSGYGVEGFANATSGTSTGVYGANSSTSGGAGVMGNSLAATGASVGVYGSVNSPTGYGVEGAAGAGTAGFFQVQSSSGTILQGNIGSTTEFLVDAAGDVTAAGAVSGSSFHAGDVTAAGAVSGSTFQIGGQLFAFGSSANNNAFLGFAGSLNTNSSVQLDTGVGYGALSGDTGGFNTAVGAGALGNNSTGGFNTAVGFAAGATKDLSNLTGVNDTALGFNTEFSTGSLSNATAIGANAIVSESNALVLGSGANVGIGTSTPGATLEVDGPNQIDVLIQAPESGVGAGLDINTTGSGGLHWEILDTGSGSGQGANKLNIRNVNTSTDILTILADGHVGIGTTSADNTLTVNGSADKPGGGSWGTYSDGRLKTVNGGFTSGLTEVMKIQPVHYRYKPDNAMGIRDTDEHIGVVAQEVQKIIPEAVTQNSKGYLLVNNDPIIWTMLNAIKQQQGEFQQEKSELAKALRLIKQQQNLLRAQSAAMRSLKAEVRETRESLRKVKAQVAAAQPALVAMK
jgi:hypothetical protein